MTSHVVTAVVAALVSGALCLGVGFTAITNGWVHVPTSSSLSDVKSNTSGSGSAKAKSGTAVDWTAVAKEVSDSVVAIDVATSDGEAKGSGVVISDKGYIATNNHVISGAQQIQVTLASGAVYSAKVVGTDTTTDLAVIKLDNPPSDLKSRNSPIPTISPSARPSWRSAIRSATTTPPPPASCPRSTAR